ncbi:penicillin acylase family protein [Sinimarinibacterium flocculans]|uniref:penicillin acylase family protein n=1 Tax=Sinimarinibacterium flocculans TaxID=985250 RepID=UPI001473DDC6|nr:penicillin acylase family protein [Sinimarinibacterium flocculans]
MRLLKRGAVIALMAGVSGCGSSSSVELGSGGQGGVDGQDEFGDVPLDFVPPSIPGPLVSDPFKDVGTVRTVLPPGQSGQGGIAGLVGDLPLLGPVLQTLLDDIVGATGLTPALSKSDNFDNQLGMYFGPTQAQPGLTRADVDRFFKDASLLPPEGPNWASEERVESGDLGATVKREAEFGVPHVYGDDRRGAFFGAGYAVAGDRLFLMDVLRRAGRGELSQFLGRAEFSFDRAINAFAPYREAERTAQFEQLRDRYGALGVQMRIDGEAFIRGVNEWIRQARMGLLDVPLEYLLLGVPLEEFVEEDVVAVATVIQAELGAGGGAEQRNVELIQALHAQTGDVETACALYHDLRMSDDPEINVTTERRFPTQEPGRLDPTVCPLRADFAQRYPGNVIFDADSFEPYAPFQAGPCGRPGQPLCPGGLLGQVPGLPAFGLVEELVDAIDQILGLGGVLGLSLDFLTDILTGREQANARRAADAVAQAQARFAAKLAEDTPEGQALREQAEAVLANALGAARSIGDVFPKSASNALLIDRSRTESGNPIAVFGPQVSYFTPQLIAEVAMYDGDQIAVRGGTIPGLPYVVVPGRGIDFAWSATSSGVDIADVRVLELCEDPRVVTPGSYRVNGVCQNFDVIEDQWTARWNLGSTFDADQIGQNFIAERRVIRSMRYGPVIGFATVGGQPVALTQERSTYFQELDAAPPFALAASNAIHDVDSFQESFSLMASAFNWFYIDAEDIAFITPSLLPARATTVYPDFPSWGNGQHDWRGVLPFERLARDRNPQTGFFANWNNQATRDWWPADSGMAGAFDRNNLLEVRAEPLVARGNVRLEEVVEAVNDAAYVDLRGQELIPRALDVIEQFLPLDDPLWPAVNLMRDWTEKPLSDRAQRRDRSGDGVYDDTQAVALMDAWWNPLLDAALPQLLPLENVNGRRLIPVGRHDSPGGEGSAYNDGWYSYLGRVLDMALGRAPVSYRQIRCAGSNQLEDCANALIASLNGAVDSLGGIGSLDSWGADQSVEEVVFQAIGVVGVPNQHWVNKPTIQWAVEFSDRR